MKKHYLPITAIFCFFIFFAGTINLDQLFNYSNQPIPNYITEDNSPSTNPITDEGATLGRVLFYDKNLSLTNTVSCASCHIQSLAFGDSLVQSIGHDGGLTGRHSTRLSSARFGEEEKFFWDERANTLEDQTTMPIQDHVEMGFSGTNGDPTIDSLITKLEAIDYYDELFNLAFDDYTITEDRMQKALAQFVRSMQSFDSKYDEGRAQVGNNNANFPNFTTAENNGKALYMSNNATGCNRCHQAPEFDIDPESKNNGVIGVAGAPGNIDLTNERSPSLRDIVNQNGDENGPFMHDGSLTTLMDVINHYDDIPNNPANTNLDDRLEGPGGNLNLSNTEKNQLLSFLKTLGGSDLYTNAKWSDPFDANGDLEILNGTVPIKLSYIEAFLNDQVIHLNWATALEINNAGFEILHSRNSIDWVDIDYVDGNNVSSAYEYIHLNPAEGSNYYKLKQFDFNGNFKFSDIRSVNIENEKEEISIYPNPTYNFVNLTASELFTQAIIYDAKGQIVQRTEINEVSRLDLTELHKGTYFIRLSNSTNQFSELKKIVKL